MLAFIYSFSVMVTIISILWDEISGSHYTKKREIFKLCLAAMVEPFVFHPIVLFFSIKGNWFFFTRKQLKWGDMKRKGFNDSNTLVYQNEQP
jgi:hypothetical protein